MAKTDNLLFELNKN